MLYSFAFRVHLVKINAGNPTVVWVITEQIDEVHVRPNVVAYSDDSVNHNSQIRAIFRHLAKEPRQTYRTIWDERIVLDVVGYEEFPHGFFGVFLVDHRVVQREDVFLVANGA